MRANAAAAAPTAADRADAEQGAAMRANAAAAAPTAADQADAEQGAAMRANAAAAAPTAADQADAEQGAAMRANAAAATQAANGVNAAGQNVTMPGGINPETGKPTVTTAGTPAAANYDAMPFNQAFAAARKAGAKDFMWKNKKYAVQMAPQQSGTPTKFPAGTVQNAAGGQTTTNAGGAATSVTRNNRPVVPGSLRAQQQANQAAATAAKPTDAQPAKPAAPLKPGLGSSPMRENTFQESVDLMRRLSTMLKG